MTSTSSLSSSLITFSNKLSKLSSNERPKNTNTVKKEASFGLGTNFPEMVQVEVEPEAQKMSISRISLLDSRSAIKTRTEPLIDSEKSVGLYFTNDDDRRNEQRQSKCCRCSKRPKYCIISFTFVSVFIVLVVALLLVLTAPVRKPINGANYSSTAFYFTVSSSLESMFEQNFTDNETLLLETIENDSSLQISIVALNMNENFTQQYLSDMES